MKQNCLCIPTTPPHSSHSLMAHQSQLLLKQSILGSKITWTTPPKAAIKFRKEKAEAAFAKIYHVWCSKLPWRAKSVIFHSTIVPVLLYGLDLCSLDKQHFKTIGAWYFRFLRRALSIKHSYYSRISNERVWKAAGKPHIPSQKILQQQFKLLIQCVTTPPNEPFHHVVFSHGYKEENLLNLNQEGTLLDIGSS